MVKTTRNRARLAVAAIVAIFIGSPLQVAAWNAPTHMVTIAYRILESESPRTVSVIKTLLEKHPWYADRWRDDVEKLPESQRGEMLFMLAARWADDIRMQAKLQREVKWHYINFPFKPASEPEDIKRLARLVLTDSSLIFGKRVWSRAIRILAPGQRDTALL
jgi:hypothetical protein